MKVEAIDFAQKDNSFILISDHYLILFYSPLKYVLNNFALFL